VKKAEEARQQASSHESGTGRTGTDAGTPSSDLFLMLAVAANLEHFSIVRNGGISLADLDDEWAKALFVALEDAFRAEEKGFEALCARIDEPRLRDLIMRKAASGEFEMNPERIVRDGVRRIRQRMLQKKIERVMVEMRRAEKASVDPARRQELLAEKMHLDEELNRLKIGAAGA
jgi:DNA primase